MKKRMGERDGSGANRTVITSLSVLVQQWRTPMTADDGRKATAASHQVMLKNQAESFQPFALADLSLPDRPTASGPKSSETRRRLNPLFVEWLMGWPEGLSGFDTAGTASCRSLELSPGCGCMDCWLTTQREHLSRLLMIAPPAQPNLL